MLKESWMRKYLRYTKDHEAPELFHFWTGMTIISAALGRKVFLDRGYYQLFPNLYTVLVAGSALCRKTTCMEIGVDILSHIETTRIISGVASREKFLSEFECPPDSEPPATLSFEEELSVFLAKDQMGIKLIDVLTKLYNCPSKYTYRTMSRGDVVLTNVHLCALMGTQPEKLQECLPDSAFGGGYASRILFIYQPSTDRKNALPVVTTQGRELRKDLIEHLQFIAKLRGEFSLDPEAIEFYTEWYKTLESPEDRRLDGYYGRKHDHLLRVAMLLAVTQAFDLKINRALLEAALLALNLVEEYLPGALSMVGSKEFRADTDRLVRMLQKFRRISHSDLLKKSYGYLNAEQFRATMETLIESGWVKRDPRKHSIYIWIGPEGSPT